MRNEKIMNYYPFPENKYSKVVIGAVLLALLLLTRDAMYSMMVWDFYTCQYLSLGIIGILGLAFLLVNRKNLKAIVTDSRMCLILLAVVVTALPMVAKGDFQLMYFSIILGMLFAVFLSYFKTLEDTARWYVVTMCVLGVWSILCAYVLRLFIDSGLVSATKYINGAGFEFYSFVFSIVPDTYVKTRNFGIFREPGVYQFFLMVGLFLNNYVISWESEKKYWIANGILAVTLLTTFATGGMIELCLLIAVLFFDKKWYRSKAILAAIAVMAVAGAAVVWYCISVKNDLYWALYDMVMKFTQNPESTGSRLGSIAMGVGIFFDHPFVGAKVETVLHSMVDYTTSTLILYNIFGILGGTLNVAGWFALVWSRERRVVVNLALLLILFMAFNTQNLTWNIFFWLFPALALTERLVPVIDKLRAKKG